jgi:hypothetical protein
MTTLRARSAKTGPGRLFCTAVLVAVGLTSILVAVPAATTRLLPVDEASSRPDFLTFRARLLATIARRDAPALMAVVHPAIKNSFGDDDGKARFQELWRPAAVDSEVWSELGGVLALGGTFDSTGSFVAPYVFSRWPTAFDGFEHVAVVGERVRIRTAPRADAPVADVSSFDILPLARQADETEGWTAVHLSGSRIRYVATRYVRSPGGYRASFSKIDGRWQMLMFVAGD